MLMCVWLRLRLHNQWDKNSSPKRDAFGKGELFKSSPEVINIAKSSDINMIFNNETTFNQKLKIAVLKSVISIHF